MVSSRQRSKRVPRPGGARNDDGDGISPNCVCTYMCIYVYLSIYPSIYLSIYLYAYTYIYMGGARDDGGDAGRCTPNTASEVVPPQRGFTA